MQNAKKISAGIVSFLLLFTSPSCNSHPEGPVKSETKLPEDRVVLDSLQMTNAGIATALPEQREIHHTIRLNGVVDVPPQNLLSICFPMGGYLKATPLLPGYPVHKGQVIATMEDQSYVQLQQDYLTTKARLDYLIPDLQRQKDLSDANATSKKSYQAVLSDFKTQEAILRSTAAKLRMMRIDPEKLTVNNISALLPLYSPIDGYVSKVNVNTGKYVNPTDVLFELVNPEDIHAAMTVFEKDMSSFKKGLRGKVSLVGQPDTWYDVGTILVTRNISDTRSGLIHCHFEKAQKDLLPGMFLTGIFDLDTHQATAIPEEALVHYMGKDYVFVSKGAREFQLVPIEAGPKDKGWVELSSSGIGDWQHSRIVIKGAYALLGKMKNKMEEN